MFRAPSSLMSLLIGLLIAVTGCGSKPDKVAIEKKIRSELAKSPEWKNLVVEMKLDGAVTSAGVNRQVDGKDYWFSFTGSDGNGGVAVRDPQGEWLCKYRYEKGKEVHSEKMTGKEDDVTKFRTLASEFASACIAASS